MALEFNGSNEKDYSKKRQIELSCVLLILFLVAPPLVVHLQIPYNIAKKKSIGFLTAD